MRYRSVLFGLFSALLLSACTQAEHASQSAAESVSECVSDIPKCEELANDGDAELQNLLGVLFEVSQDYVTAVRWFRVAAEQGLADAQSSLGEQYINGRGVDQDLAEGILWLRLAAEQEHWEAQYMLGVLYFNGRGVNHDDVEAVRWFRRAAVQEHPVAMGYLGAMYAQGRGVPQNDERAYLWLSLAAAEMTAADDNRALVVKGRNAVLEKFTPEQRAKVRALAATCQKSGFTDCGEPSFDTDRVVELTGSDCPKIEHSASFSEAKSALVALSKEVERSSLEMASDKQGEALVSHLIVAEGCEEMLQWMLNEYGSSYVESLGTFTQSGMNALHIAVNEGNISMTKILIDAGMDVGTTMNGPLILLKRSGSLDDAEFIKDPTTLDLAILNGDDELTELIRGESEPWWKFW